MSCCLASGLVARLLVARTHTCSCRPGSFIACGFRFQRTRATASRALESPKSHKGTSIATRCRVTVGGAVSGGGVRKCNSPGGWGWWPAIPIWPCGSLLPGGHPTEISASNKSVHSIATFFSRAPAGTSRCPQWGSGGAGCSALIQRAALLKALTAELCGNIDELHRFLCKKLLINST